MVFWWANPRLRRIKHEIGTAYPGKEMMEIDVKGRNLSEGVPKSFSLNSNEILEALQEPLYGIISAVKNGHWNKLLQN